MALPEVDCNGSAGGFGTMQASAVMSFEGPKVASILRLAAPLLAAFAVFLGACTMTETEQRTVSGAGIGAGAQSVPL
jgi:hypothetical protein